MLPTDRFVVYRKKHDQNRDGVEETIPNKWPPI